MGCSSSFVVWYRGTVAARYLAQYETLLAVDSCRSDSNGDSVTRAVPCSPGVYAMSELCRVLRRTCPVRVEGRARARGGGRWWVNVLSTNAGARTVALVVYHLELGFFPDCSRGGARGSLRGRARDRGESHLLFSRLGVARSRVSGFRESPTEQCGGYPESVAGSCSRPEVAVLAPREHLHSLRSCGVLSHCRRVLGCRCDVSAFPVYRIRCARAGGAGPFCRVDVVDGFSARVRVMFTVAGGCHVCVRSAIFVVYRSMPYCMSVLSASRSVGVLCWRFPRYRRGFGAGLEYFDFCATSSFAVFVSGRVLGDCREAGLCGGSLGEC